MNIACNQKLFSEKRDQRNWKIYFRKDFLIDLFFIHLSDWSYKINRKREIIMRRSRELENEMKKRLDLNEDELGELDDYLVEFSSK